MGWTEYPATMKTSEMLQMEYEKLEVNRNVGTTSNNIGQPINNQIVDFSNKNNNTPTISYPSLNLTSSTISVSNIPDTPIISNQSQSLWDNVSTNFSGAPPDLNLSSSSTIPSPNSVFSSLSNTGSAMSQIAGPLQNSNMSDPNTPAPTLANNFALGTIPSLNDPILDTTPSPNNGGLGDLNLSKTQGLDTKLKFEAMPELSQSSLTVKDTNKRFKAFGTDFIKNKKGNTKLFNIGNPCKFNENVDPEGRISSYMRAKMQVIDLIPCDYKFNFSNLKDQTTQKKSAFGGIHTISYDDRIAEYNRICTFHGLQRRNNNKADNVDWGGIRIFSTDDSTMSEQITVGYKANSLQTFENNINNVTAPYRDFARSIVSPASLNKAFASGKKALSDLSYAAGKSVGAKEGMTNFLSTLADVGIDMASKGYRTNFVKTWDNSQYNSNLSATIKLVSPYGHPDAIKEFIIRPFLHLLLLIAPHTTNGFTYGDNIPLTVKAYGLEYLAIGAISGIDFTRGGGSTSFNLYKQPLTVDIRLSFQTLCDGFAVFAPDLVDATEEKLKDIAGTEYDLFAKPELSEPTSIQSYNNTTYLFKTASSIIKTLQPVQILNNPKDYQNYGIYIPDQQRKDPPGYTSYSPLGGPTGINKILASASSVLGIGENLVGALKAGTVSDMFSGLSSAVLGTAKLASGYLTGNAINSLNTLTNISNSISIVPTITGNIIPKIQTVSTEVQKLFTTPR